MFEIFKEIIWCIRACPFCYNHCSLGGCSIHCTLLAGHLWALEGSGLLRVTTITMVLKVTTMGGLRETTVEKFEGDHTIV